MEKSIHFPRDYQDGRSSEAMAALLESVRLVSNIKVLAFDPGVPANRDGGMADNLSRALRTSPQSKMVILAGNLHMGLKMGYPADPNFRPALFQLIERPGSPLRSTELVNVLARYSQGSTWACYSSQARECGPKAIDHKSNYSRARSEDVYFLKEPSLSDEGYSSSVFFRKVEASAPFVKAAQSRPQE